MRRLFYGIISFKYDLLSSAGAINAPLVAYYFGYDEKIITTIFVVVFLLIVVHLRLKDRDFYYIPLTKSKDKDAWIGSGIFEYSKTDSCFRITNAESGYIYSKCLTWSDYQLKFDFKIVKNCLGVILRATNVSNYVMLQINEDGIRPHVRINGWWHVWDPEEVDLILSKKISMNHWHKCCISCNKRNINIAIKNKRNEQVFDGQWKLPLGNVFFSPSKNNEKTSALSDPVSGALACHLKETEALDLQLKMPFPITLEYGSAGFRNWEQEEALLRNVLIKKI